MESGAKNQETEMQAKLDAALYASAESLRIATALLYRRFCPSPARRSGNNSA